MTEGFSAEFPDPTGKVHDYTEMGWGHAIASLHWNEEEKEHSGLLFHAFGVSPGDRLALKSGDQLFVLTVGPLGDPPDMYRFTAKRLSDEGIAHFDSLIPEENDV